MREFAIGVLSAAAFAFAMIWFAYRQITRSVRGIAQDA